MFRNRRSNIPSVTNMICVHLTCKNAFDEYERFLAKTKEEVDWHKTGIMTLRLSASLWGWYVSCYFEAYLNEKIVADIQFWREKQPEEEDLPSLEDLLKVFRHL